MQTPAISIIVPVYNVEKYLSQCLDSLVNQTMNDIEIICINDGSKDESLSILQYYSQKDSRFKIIDKLNEGVSIARNVGLLHALGDYVMFVDSDDWLDLETCEVAYKTAKEHNADCVYFSYTKVFEGHKIENHLFAERKVVLCGDTFISGFYRRLIGPMGIELASPQNIDSLVSPCMQLFKRDLIGKSKFINIKEIGTAEDLLFQLEIYKNCNKLVYLDKPYYFYRRTEIGTLTTKYMPDKYEKWRILFNYIRKISECETYTTFQDALNNRIALSSLGLGLNEVYSKDNFLTRSKKYHEILSSTPYFEALKSLQLHFMPIHWRLFYFLCKHRQAFLAMLMLECIEYLRTHKH